MKKKSQKSDTRQTALITGGSSGIGLELAKLFAADGYALFIAALNQKELSAAKALLEREYQTPVTILEKDLSQPQAAQEVFDFARQQNITVDVLVNNAGFGSYGLFHETDFNHEYNMILVNCGATMALSKLFYPHMVQRGRGKILNIASTVGLQPTPHMAVYSGTKAFIKYFSLALSEEARAQNKNITVTTVYPYATRTNFEKASSMQNHRLFENPFTLDPDTVARAAYKAMRKGKLEVFLPRGSRLVFDFLYRFLTQRGKMRLVKWGIRK